MEAPVTKRLTTDPTLGSASTPLNDIFGESIFVYTRADAIADGMLVDVTASASDGPEGMLGGFTVPVAITRSLWIALDIDTREDPGEPRWHRLARECGESTRGRAHDVLWLANLAARRAVGRDRTRYPVLITLEGPDGTLVPKTVWVELRIDGNGVTVGVSEDF
jgi:hypothetical protein